MKRLSYRAGMGLIGLALLAFVGVASCGDPAPTVAGANVRANAHTVQQVAGRVWRVHDKEAKVTCWFIEPLSGVQGGSGAISCIADSHYPGSVP